VDAARKHNVLIIENDMLGDIPYVASPVPSLKQFDIDDNVLQFSGFENVLCAGYGFGWVVAGRHTRKLLATQYFNGSTSRDGLIERAVAEYLSNRSHDRQLRVIRSLLAARMQKGRELVADFFPSECSISRPDGGYMCWLRCPASVDVQAISQMAMQDEISVLPGSSFSVVGSFKNFLALNFSFPWTAQNISKIKRLGGLVKKSLAST